MDDLAGKWDESYKRKENFLFFPNEELIRFCSKFIAKRTGIENISPVAPGAGGRLLDLGCGIGRHIIFFSSMGLEAYGIDLSEAAIATAREWAAREGIATPEKRIVKGDADGLPWDDSFFTYVVSHGVLDSMPFKQAMQTVDEMGRVLASDGLVYCDLVSGDDSKHGREFAGEEVVDTLHEQGTIQSYFNYGKISRLFPRERFEMMECILIRRENVVTGDFISRYHLTLRKK